ncbi:MAG TPA: HNH endonuclease [Nitrososphaeraceae archaeon]
MKGQKFGMLTIIKDTGKKFENTGIIYLCKCDCGNQKEVSWKLLRNEKKPRSCGCSRKIKGKERFESLYEKTPGCWEWKGTLNTGGYGKFRGISASRVQYQYVHGTIPDNLQVCHTCDNRKCVNPAHLFLGTIGDNLKDMTDKGRRARGSDIASSILTEQMVLEIRQMRLSGKEYQEISDHFNVKWATVACICKNKQWQHVALGEECKNMKQIRKVAQGSQAGTSKLNEDNVIEIRKMLSQGVSAKEIAQQFNVTYWAVCDIRQRRTWKHI